MAESGRRPELTHVDATGQVHMVDVGAKPVSRRQATASAVVSMKRDVLDSLMAGALPKGDAQATARIAGITAAKRTSEWIPLCHVLALDSVAIQFERVAETELRVLCTATATARTGVEMEAMTGACAAGLCLYDMAKAGDRAITIGPVQLEDKSGGRSGDYRRATSTILPK